MGLKTMIFYGRKM